MLLPSVVNSGAADFFEINSPPDKNAAIRIYNRIYRYLTVTYYTKKAHVKSMCFFLSNFIFFTHT